MSCSPHVDNARLTAHVSIDLTQPPFAYHAMLMKNHMEISLNEVTLYLYVLVLQCTFVRVRFTSTLATTAAVVHYRCALS